MALKAEPTSETDVDIMECGNPRDEFQEEEEVFCQASSSSSSFCDSMCARDGDEDEEAQSMLNKDYPLPETCDGAEILGGLTKKKLTDRWRRFSLPLSWRCKWLELKVKEIESQARGYDKEIESYYETKLSDLEKSKLEGFEGKSIAFSDQTQRMKLFKRGVRKRVEETTDVAAFRANHNIFSYAAKRMPIALKAQYLDLEFGKGRKATSKEGGIEDDCLVSELDCCDDVLAKVMCKIDEAQERARGLKNRVDRLMPDTAVRGQREVTEQSGRGHVGPDHTEDRLRHQTPPIQCLNNKSPISSGGLPFNTILEDLLMDGTEVNNDEMNEAKLEYFRKLINKMTGVPPVLSEEADAKEDPTPVSKRRKISH